MVIRLLVLYLGLVLFATTAWTYIVQPKYLGSEGIQNSCYTQDIDMPEMYWGISPKVFWVKDLVSVLDLDRYYVALIQNHQSWWSGYDSPQIIRFDLDNVKRVECPQTIYSKVHKLF